MTKHLLPISLLFVMACAAASPIARNQYGLPVVRDLALYEQLVRRDSSKRLVDVGLLIPTARIDVRYATADNFMHEPLYPVARVYLRDPAALALVAVQKDLAAEGLGLKIFDGYRPYRVTERMWKIVGNPDYVADPAKGSRHNRGAAVDLTLFDLSTGSELVMPTPFDDFTARAGLGFQDLPPLAIANRTRLRNVMERHGFGPLPSEWWHYDFHGWERFELLDLDLESIAASSQKASSAARIDRRETS